MPKGYWVVDLEVSDPEAYKTYQAFVRPFLAENEGRFLDPGRRAAGGRGTMNSAGGE